MIAALASFAHLGVGLIALTGSRVTIADFIFVVPWIALLTFSLCQIYVAIGLRKLDPWSRRPAIVLSFFGLLGFPIVTVLSIYAIYLLLSNKATMVFSEQYKDIIRQTPHIKYRTSIIVWIASALLLVLIILGFVDELSR